MSATVPGVRRGRTYRRSVTSTAATVRDPSGGWFARHWASTWRLSLAGTVGVLLWIVVVAGDTSRHYHGVAGWPMVDLLLGALLLPLLLWRRKYPLPVALVLVASTAFLVAGIGAAAIAVISLSTGRQWSRIALVSGWWVVTGTVFAFVHPSTAPSADLLGTETTGVLSVAMLVALGLFIGARRELLARLHERIETAEREQASRVAQARVGERARIAREMHDVLAHRISLVAMHSGALAYREDLPAETVRETARMIQDNSHQALTELREVLGVLRDTDGRDDRPQPPQPLLSDLAGLVADLNVEGAQVHLSANGDLDDVPGTLSRTGFRILQESLTNARKHAPGIPVHATVTVVAGDHVALEVRNPVPTTTRGPHHPPSGLGLLGLTERAALSGGRLQYGVDRRREFVVTAWLPWFRDAPR